MEFLYILIGFCFGSVLSWLLLDLYQKANWVKRKEYESQKAQSELLKADLAKWQERAQGFEKQLAEVKKQLQGQETEREGLKVKLGASNAQLESLRQQLTDREESLEKLHQKFEYNFDKVARKLFEENSSNMAKQNTENLSHLLEPLKIQLKDFKDQVHKVYDSEAKQRFALEKEIKQLHELNLQVSQEANNLAKALKGDTKTQGDWGEMILESILERSGLAKGREYFLQQEYTDDAGKRKRPDVVVHFPHERSVVIDSKVSLAAYERFTHSESEEERKAHLNEHIRAVKRHVDQLSNKRYDEQSRSLDFVIMFVPIEPAYLAALQGDPQLWHFAYRKRIVMVSPTNLIALLKMTADLWVREKRDLNAQSIAEKAEKVYDKFIGFAEDFEKLGKELDHAKEAWEGSLKKLTKGKGNVVRQLEQLKAYGVTPKKSLPNKLESYD